MALSSYRNYNNNVPQNLSDDEFIALQNLSKNRHKIIQKSGKSNSVVIVDRRDYIKKIDNIWSDQKETYHSNLERWHFIEFCCEPRKTHWQGYQKLSESKSATEKTKKLLKPVGSKQTRPYSRFM